MCKRLQIFSIIIGILTVLALLMMTGGCANSALPSATPAATVSKTSTPALSSSSVPLTTPAAAPPAPASSTSQPPPPATSQPAASPKPPAPSSQPPPAVSQPPPAGGGAAPAPAPGGGASPVPLPSMSGKLIVTSSVVKDGGILKDPYACNGASSGTDVSGKSLPLTWTGAPAGTKSFAVLITTIRGGGDEGVFLVVYNIPGTATGLPEGIAEDTVDPKIGTLGSNDHSANAYQLPCGGGTGTFNYTVIVYALSKMPDKLTDPKAADATALRDAITGSILDAGSMTFDVILQ